MKRSFTKPARFLKVFLSFFLFFSSYGLSEADGGIDAIKTQFESQLRELREAVTKKDLRDPRSVLSAVDKEPTERGSGGHAVNTGDSDLGQLVAKVIRLSKQIDPDLANKPDEAVIETLLFPKEPEPTGEKLEDEKPEKEEPDKKTAKKDPKDPFEDILRDLENQVRPPEQQPQPRGATGPGEGGDPSGGQPGGQPFFPQGPDPSSANDNNNGSNSSIDRLADRLGSRPEPNFSDFTSNANKKNETEKPKFSLEPSKSSLDKDSFLGNSSASSKPKLPGLSASPEGALDDKDSDIDFVGTPLQPKASALQGGAGVPSPLGDAGGMMGGGMMGGGNMGGGMMGGMLAGGQAGFNSMGGDMDLSFPFDVTGEVPDQESDYEQWPRYRVVKIPMTGGSGGGLTSSFSGSSGGAVSDDSTGAVMKKGNNESFYILNPAEASLKEVPGIFRSMASGFRKTRVQNLCENSPKMKIGLCQRRLK